MGCLQSLSKGVKNGSPDPSGGLVGERVSGRSFNRAASDFDDVVLPDPDLGWRKAHTNRGGSPQQEIVLPRCPILDGGEFRLVPYFNVRSGMNCSVSLPLLAINVGVRAAQLAMRFGVVGDEDGPAVSIAEGGGNSSPSVNRIADGDADGSFATAATPGATGLPHSASKGAASQAHSEGQGKSGGPVGNADAPRSLAKNFVVHEDPREIYKALGVPDYKWRLVGRDLKMRDVRCSLPRKSATKSSILSSLTAAATTAPSTLSAGRLEAFEVGLEVQKLVDPGGRLVYAECGTIGINISEQLLRLERENSDAAPTDTFGWTISKNETVAVPDAITVVSPTNEAFIVVPEELLMSVFSWIQDTYLTQPMIYE